MIIAVVVQLRIAKEIDTGDEERHKPEVTRWTVETQRGRRRLLDFSI